MILSSFFYFCIYLSLLRDYSSPSHPFSHLPLHSYPAPSLYNAVLTMENFYFPISCSYSEDLELGTTGEKEHTTSVFLGLSLPHSMWSSLVPSTYFKILWLLGRRDGSVVKGTASSSCGPGFNSQHPHGSSQLTIIPVAWDPTTFTHTRSKKHQCI